MSILQLPVRDSEDNDICFFVFMNIILPELNQIWLQPVDPNHPLQPQEGMEPQNHSFHHGQ